MTYGQIKMINEWNCDRNNVNLFWPKKRDSWRRSFCKVLLKKITRFGVQKEKWISDIDRVIGLKCSKKSLIHTILSKIIKIIADIFLIGHV